MLGVLRVNRIIKMMKNVTVIVRLAIIQMR